MPFFGSTGDFHIVGTNIKGGTDALSVVLGDYNIALGNGALQYATTNNYNIAVGQNALNALASTGNYNTAVGHSAAFTFSSGNDNTFVGASPFGYIGSYNVVLGANAGAISDADASNNVFVGWYAGPGYHSTHVTNQVQSSIFIGKNCGKDLADTSTIQNNILIGTISGAALPSNSENIVVGSDGITYDYVEIGGIVLKDTAGGTNAQLPDGLIVGNPGTEGAGINVNGVTYNSTFKVSEISASDIAQTILHRHSTTLAPMLIGARSNSDTSSHANVTNSMPLFGEYAVGYAGSNYKVFGLELFSADDTGTISNTSAPGQWEIAVTQDGAVFPTTAIRVGNTLAFEVKNLLDISNSSAGQIKFPASQNASADPNTLDNYEEGTFTPTFTFATPGDLSVSYSEQFGYYTVIGDRCFINIFLTCTPTFSTSTGAIRIDGLPFTVSISSTGLCASKQAGLTLPGDSSTIVALAFSASTYLNLQCYGNTTNLTSLSATHVTSGAQMQVRVSLDFTV